MSRADLSDAPEDGWFEVDLAPPDLSPWRSGNGGVPGFITLDAPRPGPHLGIVSLIHGNEFAGAIALDRLLRRGLSPARGRLTLGFAHLDAFDRFDPAHPIAARFIQEDLNRVWDPARLTAPDTLERRRACEILPLLMQFDALLDLHSMLWPSDPVLLVPGQSRLVEDDPRRAGEPAFAQRLGLDCIIVTDPGHAAGPRMIDHPHFAGPARASLLEAGPHWHRTTVELSEDAVLGAMRALDMLGAGPAHHRLPRPAASPRPRLARVITTVTAQSRGFAFRHPYRGGTIIPHAGTLIARDGDVEIRTPCDSCLLVMPTPHPRPGHTAVRLAELLPA